MIKTYFTIQPLSNNQAMFDDDEVIRTPEIFYINDKNENSMFDHVFYIDSEEELMEYDNIYEFATTAFVMALDFFDDAEYVIDEIFIRFNDIETDQPKFGLFVGFDNEIDDFYIGTFDFADMCNKCDCECDECSMYITQADKDNYNDCECDCCEDVLENDYYFGFGDV